MKGLFLLLSMLALTCFNKTALGYAANTDTYIRIELSKDALIRDETVIIFRNKAKPGYDFNEDARYLQGAGQVRLFSYAEQTSLVFNTQPYPVTKSTTRLNIFTRSDGTFRLRLNQIVNLPKQIDVWLVDDLLKDSIDLRYNTGYTFNVSKADTNTFGGNRFKIVAKHNTAKDCHLLSFKTDVSNNKKSVDINWLTENQDDNTLFMVEHSVDNGKSYTMLDSLPATEQSTYTLTDKSPVMGINLYRLKQKDFSDNITYSEVRKVILNGDQPVSINTFRSVNIYPNPAVNMVTVATGDKLPAGNYNLTITNAWGLKVKEASTTGQQWQGEVGNLKPGIYMVTITSKTDNKVVGYNKFLKN